MVRPADGYLIPLVNEIPRDREGLLPGRRDLPGDQLPVRAAGLGSGQDGSSRILRASSRVIDSRWITSRRIPLSTAVS